MPEQLSALESDRDAVVQQLARLGDFRPGSVTAAFRRCGKPSCHCAQAKDPGHGPGFQLTYKTGGKTVTETLPSRAAVEKAEREVTEFRRFEQLSRQWIEVNQKICRLRPIQKEPEGWNAEEKKRLLRSIRKSRGK
jgi:hypothetical protein